jgi:hypothetical protein
MATTTRIRAALIGLVVAGAFALLLAVTPGRVGAQVSAMLPEQLKNLTYPSQFTVSGFAPLRDGQYDQRADLGDPMHPAHVTFVTSSTHADYSAVILATNTGGSGVFATLHLVRAQNGVAVAGPGLFMGDRLKIEKIGRDDNGRLQVTLITQGPNEPMCCGTKEEVRDYDAVGNGFRLFAVDGEEVTPAPPKTGNLGPSDSSGTRYALLIAAVALPLLTRRGTRPARR